MTDGKFDVCVVGAGVAGVACAQGLARRGMSVALLDRLHPMPDCLKGEKIESEAMPALLRLGFKRVVDEMTPLRSVTAFFGERHLGTAPLNPPEAGTLYHALINNMRAELDPRVDFRPGVKAVAVEQKADGAEIVTDKGERIATRLVVMATGDAHQLLHQLGATHESVMPHDVFAVAWNMEGALGDPALPVDSQTFHHPIAGGPVAYATFFRLGNALRANIFCPGVVSDEWQRDLKQRPLEVLSAHNRHLAVAARSWRATSGVITRKIAVTKINMPPIPRVVVIGDAAHRVDPSGSGGLTFSLLDAELLYRTHVPRWAEKNDFSAEAIALFYADPSREEAMDQFFSRGRYIFDLNHDKSVRGNSRRLRFALRHMLDSYARTRDADGATWQPAAPYLSEQFKQGARSWTEQLFGRAPKRTM